MTRAAVLSLVAMAGCKAAVVSPAPAPAPAPPADPPAEVAPPDDEEPDPDDPELADGNADDGSNPEETAADLPPPPPPVTPASALSKDTIRRVVSRHRKDFARCYEDEVAKQPTLAGRVETTFVVGPDGKVVSARATGLHPAIETCMVSALRAMRFPPPTGGGSVTVNYPFQFASAGDTP